MISHLHPRALLRERPVEVSEGVVAGRVDFPARKGSKAAEIERQTTSEIEQQSSVMSQKRREFEGPVATEEGTPQKQFGGEHRDGENDEDEEVVFAPVELLADLVEDVVHELVRVLVARELDQNRAQYARKQIAELTWCW